MFSLIQSVGLHPFVRSTNRRCAMSTTRKLGIAAGLGAVIAAAHWRAISGRTRKRLIVAGVLALGRQAYCDLYWFLERSAY